MNNTTKVIAGIISITLLISVVIFWYNVAKSKGLINPNFKIIGNDTKLGLIYWKSGSVKGVYRIGDKVNAFPVDGGFLTLETLQNGSINYYLMKENGDVYKNGIAA